MLTAMNTIWKMAFFIFNTNSEVQFRGGTNEGLVCFREGVDSGVEIMHVFGIVGGGGRVVAMGVLRGGDVDTCLIFKISEMFIWLFWFHEITSFFMMNYTSSFIF